MLFFITCRFRGVAIEKPDGFGQERVVLYKSTANVSILALSTNNIVAAGNGSVGYGDENVKIKEWKNASDRSCY